jgi:hypothetical protein
MMNLVIAQSKLQIVLLFKKKKKKKKPYCWPLVIYCEWIPQPKSCDSRGSVDFQGRDIFFKLHSNQLHLLFGEYTPFQALLACAKLFLFMDCV